MSQHTNQALWDALGTVNDPDVLRPVTELEMVERAEVIDGIAYVKFNLTIPSCPQRSGLEKRLHDAALTVPGVTAAEIEMDVMTAAQREVFGEKVRNGKPVRENRFGADSLTRVIAVTSGKGGVGKSSVTVGLATCLAQLGRKVGIIDADVFGFSIPALMGLAKDGIIPSPTRVDDMILPPVAHGVKVISIGMFLNGKDTRTQAVSWRGPMLHRTIEQFLRDVWFGDLDYLLLDMPPGTGDIAISVAQLLPQAEIIAVTTPQLAAADVAVRSALLGTQTGQSILGVIETMSQAVTSDGYVLDLFGSGGGQTVADRLAELTGKPVPLLGSLPISRDFRLAGDSGMPAPISYPTDPASIALTTIAAQIDGKGRQLAHKKLPISLA